MEEELMKDLKQAMKDGNTIKKNTIQLIRSNLLLMKKENPNVTQTEIEDMLIKEKKKRQDALLQFEKAGRQDLIEQTTKEIGFISNYLPTPLSETEVEELVKQVIAETNAQSNDIGKVMRICRERAGSRTDGRTLSNIVKKELGI